MTLSASVLLLAPVAAEPVGVAVAASDPGSSRLVYATVVGLAVIGVAFVVLAVWLIRQTRVDPVVLAPLERMGDGDWRRKDPATQRRMLDEVRPEGAEPLDPIADPPGVDDEFERAGRSIRSLDDLEPLRPEGADATPIEDTSPLLPDPVVDEPDGDGSSDTDHGSEPVAHTDGGADAEQDDDANRDDAGRDDAGRDDAGRDDAGRDDADGDDDSAEDAADEQDGEPRSAEVERR